MGMRSDADVRTQGSFLCDEGLNHVKGAVPLGSCTLLQTLHFQLRLNVPQA